ncbi:hypothetical protein Mpsy_1910 [Methanolobus psychrophilus R15]|nr:hypothetical protein Mpsy_1910 [Methanolobus psychrophilus R15]
MGMDRMTWEYAEKYSGESSVIMRSVIDSEMGNNDGFIAAWELLKMDTLSRRNLHTSVSRKMDVKINDSSASISLSKVECAMSTELIGPVSKQDEVSNIYRVCYAFRDPLAEQGSRIWFQGEPGTYVFISMPEGTEIISAEGVDNATIGMQGLVPYVEGYFDLTGESVIVFSMNTTVTSNPQTIESVSLRTDLPDVQSLNPSSPLDKVFPGSTDKLLERLRRSSKL